MAKIVCFPHMAQDLQAIDEECWPFLFRGDTDVAKSRDVKKGGVLSKHYNTYYIYICIYIMPI